MGFYIGKLFIGFYGLSIVIGVIIAWLLLIPIIKKYQIDNYNIIIVNCIMVLAGILGAKILYLVLNHENILFVIKTNNIVAFNNYMNSGFVFFGGLIMMYIIYIFFRLKHKTAYTDIIEYTFPAYIICQAFGRVGCGIVGCCYGVAHASFPYIVYQTSSFAPNNIRLFPTQYTEAIFQLFIGIILLFFIYKKGNNNIFIYYYLILYSIFRFIIEFYRGDSERGFILSFSTSQIISVFVILYSIIHIVITYIISKIKAHNALPNNKKARQVA